MIRTMHRSLASSYMVVWSHQNNRKSTRFFEHCSNRLLYITYMWYVGEEIKYFEKWKLNKYFFFNFFTYKINKQVVVKKQRFVQLHVSFLGIFISFWKVINNCLRNVVMETCSYNPLICRQNCIFFFSKKIQLHL